MKKQKFYITTPIYYPSDKLHIGHTYCTVATDAMARYKRLTGCDVLFLTGTDEHGQKIEDKAKAAGKTPKEFLDNIVEGPQGILDLWKLMNISNDRFIRTTDDYHCQSIQKIFRKMYEKGDIYKGTYKGKYCKPCESFWTESQLVDGKCPDCGREVQDAEEEAYFFRLSKYADKIIKLYEDNPEFLQPKSRMNEMINNFLKPGLQDLCVSRTSIKWGIPVTFDEKHTVYVWMDALSNYITALGYGSENDGLFRRYWPADLHMVGKEIVRFHAIIWPAILMALGLPLPKQVYGHGWLLIGGDKLSKSKEGNVKAELTDPKQLVERYGSDALRYFLLREIPFGSDGVYTNESLLARINSDLANDLGNLVSRTTAMINQYFGGVLPQAGEREGTDGELIAAAENLHENVKKAMDALDCPQALAEIFRLVQRANKYIDETTPWILAKDEGKKARLGAVLYNLAESIRIAAVYLKPYITKAPDEILGCFGIDGAEVKDFESANRFGVLRVGTAVKKAPPIFPRIDVKKELAEIEKAVKKAHKEDKKQVKENVSVAEKEEIDFEAFSKVQLKVALVTACEKVEKSKKLLKLTVKLGGETRTVVSGIAMAYTPEEMVGKKIVMVTNLKPAKLCGIMSEGMIVCAENDKGEISLIRPEKDMEDGSNIF